MVELTAKMTARMATDQKEATLKERINLSEKNQEEASVTTDRRVIALTVTNQKELTLKEMTDLKEVVHSVTGQREHSEAKGHVKTVLTVTDQRDLSERQAS